MKDVTLKVRVTPDQRDAWTKAALKAGAANLSDFIRTTIDEEIKWEAVSFEDTKKFLDSLTAGSTGSSPEPDVFVAKTDDIANNVVCPRKFTHVPGVYCTACGTTPA